MRRILIIIIVAAATLWALPSRAQSIDAFKLHLAAPAVSETGSLAKVSVAEYGDAARAVADASARTSQRLRVRGYRVCIYFDNGQDGNDPRAGAMAAKSLFEQTYPGIRVDWYYDAPYFRVLAGTCLTSEEAIILKGRVSGTFPKAFPKSEELSISDILN